MAASDPARQIRYCTTADGVTIAYAVSGHGERWLVHTCNAMSAMIQYDVIPGRREWIDKLGERFTVVQYDSRGTGLSQRECESLAPDCLVLDLAAVVGAIGVDQVSLFGFLGSAFAAAAYAGDHPDRVTHLMLWPPPQIDFRSASNTALARLAVSDWQTFTETFAHLALGWARGEHSHAYATVMRDTVQHETWLRFMGGFVEQDMEMWTEVLRRVTTPTLVIQRQNYEDFAAFAGSIPGATIRMVPGESNGPYVEEQQAVLDAIFEFTGVAGPASVPSETPPVGTGKTAVVLFTDIADSSVLTERMGDAAFRAASRALDDRVRDAIRECGGTPVEGKVLGDGVMGVFTSGAQAIAAARACVDASGELPMHIGLHAGDVLSEGTNVYGGAVNIASRICGLCAPGEILVSGTVRDLARTSAGVTFEDRGEHALKGIADPVRVFAVRPLS